MLVAGQRLAELQTDALYHNTDLPVPYKLESRVLVYLREFQAAYSKTDGNKISAMIEKFVEFEKGTPIQFKHLNQNTVQDFRNLIVESYAPQTARAYFGKFKQIIKRANVDRYTTYNIENFKSGISNETLKDLVKRAGIQKHITWHCLRHSFGTNTVGDDGDIAALLGHADNSMIKLYRHRKNEKLATVVNSLPPVAIK